MKKFLRVYQKIDIDAVRPNLLVYGDISGSCANCQQIDIKLDAARCPKCEQEFRYIAFRNIRSHIAKLEKLLNERPQLTFIDFDDYKRIEGDQKARNFLK